MDIINRIHDWNTERSLHKVNFSLTRETSFIVEELLEAWGIREVVTNKEDVDRTIREITSRISDWAPTSPEDQADAFGDIVVFAIGALTKLHYAYNTPHPSVVLKTIMDHNDTKPVTVDNAGKIVKPSNFIEPKHEISNPKKPT